ncbi:hypothetical protein [Asticcacaulis endophyticus]|uniref:Uncharacterized protein n=1 Tax=Asticcacaulis endophyticus TaxID=1395890 RepID=A0A918QC55_9CAUL|nr:hypothetical protein [Asticcacaulis endophyticus]GGZ38986.1 hypothetical protein GCM10011273_26670 [Asticcacaulis endophyticus]
MASRLHFLPIKPDVLERLAKTIDPQALRQERAVLTSSIVDQASILEKEVAATVSRMQELGTLPDEKAAFIQTCHELKNAIKALGKSVEALREVVALFPAKA